MPKPHYTLSYPPHTLFVNYKNVEREAPFFDGDFCPHCQGGILNQHPVSRQLICDLDWCSANLPCSVYEPDPEEAKSSKPVADGKAYVLEGFPDYEFDSLGTPTRVTARSKGPKPNLGPVKPVKETKSRRYYSLSGLESRIVLNDSQIRSLIVGKKEIPTGWFELPDFPRNFFDGMGRAFSKVGEMLPCKYASTMKDGFEVRRYRLFHEPTGIYQYITDRGARRMRTGDCSLFQADIPDSCREIGQEFPDYCADWETGQPYRISSPRYRVYAPQRCNPRSDGKFYIFNYRGLRRILSSSEILKEMGSPYYLPPVPFTEDTTVKDLLAEIAKKTAEERKALFASGCP